MTIITPGGCNQKIKMGKRRGNRCGKEVVAVISSTRLGSLPDQFCEYHLRKHDDEVRKENLALIQQRREDIDNVKLGRWIRKNRPGQFEMFLEHIADYEKKY